MQNTIPERQLNSYAEVDLGEQGVNCMNPLERVANLDRVLPAKAGKDLYGGRSECRDRRREGKLGDTP